MRAAPVATGPRDGVDRGVRTVLVAALVLVAVVVPGGLSAGNLYLVSAGVAWSVAALSLVVLLGMVGQFSLAQAAFMGVGAMAAAHLVTGAHVPFVLAVPLGGLAAVPVGVLAALPALRVGGVQLAVVTLGFGQALSGLFLQADVNGGGLGGIPLPRPGGLDQPLHYYWFELAVLLGLCAFVALMRTRRTGRNLAAVRAGEAMAATVGIDVVRAKVVAFSLSAFIAGVAGVLYSGLGEVFSGAAYTPFDSIALMAVAVIGGIGTVAGAVAAGLLKTVAPVLIAHLPGVSALPDLVGILFGAGLVAQLVTAPLGIAAQALAAEEALARRLRWLLHGGEAAAGVGAVS